MSLVIHTDPLSLPQQDLPDRFQAAIRAADDAQQTHGDDGPYRGSGREPPTWQRDGTVDYIDLDGVRFIPDQVDRRRGMLDTLAGTIALLFALILLAAGLQGGEPRLLPYGIGLGALSAFMFWRGRRTQERAQQEPRLTGLYLFDDALLQLTLHGCRVFPKHCLRQFQYVSTGESWTLRVLYLRDERMHDLDLSGPDATALLREWLD